MDEMLEMVTSVKHPVDVNTSLNMNLIRIEFEGIVFLKGENTKYKLSYF